MVMARRFRLCFFAAHILRDEACHAPLSAVCFTCLLQKGVADGRYYGFIRNFMAFSLPCPVFLLLIFHFPLFATMPPAGSSFRHAMSAAEAALFLPEGAKTFIVSPPFSARTPILQTRDIRSAATASADAAGAAIRVRMLLAAGR